MLNDEGVLKKRTPMAYISNYFTSREEFKEPEALPVSIIMQKPDSSECLLYPELPSLYLKFDPHQDGISGQILVSKDSMFKEPMLSISSKCIKSLTPSANKTGTNINPQLYVEIEGSDDKILIELILPDRAF